MHAVGAPGAAGLLGRSTGLPPGDASLRLSGQEAPGEVRPQVWFWLRGLGTLSKAIPGAWAVGVLSQDRGCVSEQRSLTRQQQQEATGLIQSPETWG